VFFAKVCVLDQGLSGRGMALSRLHLIHEKAGGLESWRAEETIRRSGFVSDLGPPPEGRSPTLQVHAKGMVNKLAIQAWSVEPTGWPA
jgi:hypothetical protein